MPTLRVVHVIGCFSPVGGMEKGLATMVRLSPPDIEHVVLSLVESHDVARLLPKGTRHINLGKKPGNSLRFIRKLARALRDLSPCVVHTRNWPGMDGIIAARLAGIRSVMHSVEGWSMPDAHGTNRKRILVRRFLSRWLRTVVCVSKDLENWLRNTVRVRCPIVQIYNGVDTDAYRGPDTSAEVRAEFGLPPDAPLIGMVARFDPIKDHPTLFRAFAKVRERFPTAALLCAGDGAERASLEKLLVPGIHLLGERRDVPRLLRGIDVSVLPSENEGISFTILEAMAAGLPVVASRVGGNPELVVDGVTGRLFPAGDATALAEAICGYLATPALRRAHGAAGLERARDHFGTEAMLDAYTRLWRDCAQLAVRR